MAGTAKKRKFFPVHKVFQLLQPEIIQSILSFHALTGCDTTSYIAGHTKHSAWKVLQHHSELLKDFGNVPLTDSIMGSVEKFFCRIYNVKRCDSIDKAGLILFPKITKPELLPPTSDALKQHILRAYLQVLVWVNADSPIIDLPPATAYGWHTGEDPKRLKPTLMKLQQVPDACLEVITCNCKKNRCRNKGYKCRKCGLLCTAMCGCRKEAEGSCMNKGH